MVLLVIVSAVIIALIVYTLTMDKVRSIATLKFVGAPDRTIVGLIVQQALSMGIFGYFAGLALVLIFQPYFPRRLVLDPESVAIVFVITVVICLAASTLGIRLALKVDPAEALASFGVARWPRPDRQPVVRVEHLSKHFGQGSARVDALRDINMEVYPGQVVGLMGPSGSGKTTLLHCIACILEPSSGRITLDGEVVYDERWLKSDLRRLRLDKIGFIFQYPNLLPFLDGSDNVAVVLDLAGIERRGRAHPRHRVARLSRGRPPQACVAQAALRRRSATGGDRARARQQAAHYSRRRADRAARFGARPHRDGSAAPDCGRSKRRDHRRHP